jgi:hypothetical protein
MKECSPQPTLSSLRQPVHPRWPWESIVSYESLLGLFFAFYKRSHLPGALVRLLLCYFKTFITLRKNWPTKNQFKRNNLRFSGNKIKKKRNMGNNGVFWQIGLNSRNKLRTLILKGTLAQNTNACTIITCVIHYNDKICLKYTWLISLIEIEKNRIPKESPSRQNCKMLQVRFDWAYSWTVLESASYRPSPLAPA